MCTLWSLALSKKSCNNINNSCVQVSRLCYFFPNEITNNMQQICRKFLWNSNNVKISMKLFISSDFQNGSLKNLDIHSKIYIAYNALGLKNYTTKTLIGNSFQCILLIIHLGKTLFLIVISHSSLSFKMSVLHQFSTFYANILQSQKRNFFHNSYIPSCIVSQSLWFRLCVIHFCLKESEREKRTPVKLEKNVFYFTPKAFFIL